MVILPPSSQGVVNWRPIAQGVPPAPSCKVKPVPDAANAVFLPHKIQLLDFDGSGLGRAAVRPTLTREERRCRDCSACRNTGSFAFRARPWGTEPPLPLAGSQVFGISPPTVCLCGCCRDRFSHNCDVIISSWLGVSSPGGAFDLSQTLQWSNGCWVVFPSQSSFPPRNNRDVCGPRPPPPPIAVARAQPPKACGLCLACLRQEHLRTFRTSPAALNATFGSCIGHHPPAWEAAVTMFSFHCPTFCMLPQTGRIFGPPPLNPFRSANGCTQCHSNLLSERTRCQQ